MKYGFGVVLVFALEIWAIAQSSRATHLFLRETAPPCLSFLDSAFTAHGFVYANGNFAHRDYPGALDTFPSGLNAQGDIVGNWDTDQSTVGHGFWISHGQIVSIDAPDAIPDGTAANGINATVNGSRHKFQADRIQGRPPYQSGRSCGLVTSASKTKDKVDPTYKNTR